jgi:hypothetical protein
MAELKVALEVAQADFERMCVARRVKLDQAGWDAEDVSTFKVLRDKAESAICAGALRIEQDGTPIFTAQGGEQKGKEFKLRPANGASLIAQDGKVGAARCFAALAELTKLNVGEFAKLEVPDVDVLSTLYTLFFQRASSI